MIHLVKKMYANAWSIVVMLIVFTSSTLKAEPLTPTELHATLGIVTNFILSDDTNKSVSHNGVTYGTVTSPYTGRVWLDRNLGASQVCTSFDDVDCYGDYYQWGRNADGHEKSQSSTTMTLATNVYNVGHNKYINNGTTVELDWASTDANGSIRSINWSAIDGSSVCPIGFRVPNIAELQGDTVDIDVINGLTAFSNFLKLPSSGLRDIYTSNIAAEGSYAYVLSVSVNNTTDAWSIGFGTAGRSLGAISRAYGASVRCIKN